jgi:hypothetical protein
MTSQVNVPAKHCTTGHMAVGTDLAPMVYAGTGVDQGVDAQVRARLHHSACHDLNAFIE